MTTPPTYASAEGVAITRDGAVLRLRLERPERRNAVSDTMMAALIAALEAAATDESVRAVVVSGAGEHFCAGADFVARNEGARSPGERPRTGAIQRRLPLQAHRLISLVLGVQLPVVCAAQGWVSGLGLQLALAADFTVAAEDARLWEPFVARGFTPDSGATWLLPRLAGLARARQLLLLGAEVSGRQAAEWGLIHAAVSASALGTAVDELTGELAAGPTVALGLTKWLLQAGAAVPLEAQLANEALALEMSSRSSDFKEGFEAFREHRPPRFSGR